MRPNWATNASAEVAAHRSSGLSNEHRSDTQTKNDLVTEVVASILLPGLKTMVVLTGQLYNLPEPLQKLLKVMNGEQTEPEEPSPIKLKRGKPASDLHK